MTKRSLIPLSAIFAILILILAPEYSWAKSLVDIIKDYERIVVDIEGTKKSSLANHGSADKWTGSGFIFEIEGGSAWILTNGHVVKEDLGIETASTEEIKKEENAEYNFSVTRMNITMKAEFVSFLPYFDIGILKIPANRLEDGAPTAILGDSDAVKPGEPVIAIGNPFNLENTATAGIISQINRNIEVQGMPSLVGGDFIQMDAPINPGNSGGPLINEKGEVIGINFAAGGQNLGFAIPINYAKKFSPKMKKEKFIEKGYAGINILQQTLKKSFNLKDLKDLTDLEYWTAVCDVETLLALNKLTEEKDYGVLIIRIEKDSPAEKIGLRRGDIIKKIGDYTIRHWRDFIFCLLETKTGKKIPIEIIRPTPAGAENLKFEIRFLSSREARKIKNVSGNENFK